MIRARINITKYDIFVILALKTVNANVGGERDKCPYVEDPLGDIQGVHVLNSKLAIFKKFKIEEIKVREKSAKLTAITSLISPKNQNIVFISVFFIIDRISETPCTQGTVLRWPR